ncbi:hypothetical protein U9M48_006484 [Paspalum notatum var. saurae]|uniref:Uncharacterized protein n=1 Tax=Paspalum notatum var. saurae TaxID=547442 RepID=A0AAQ3PYU0_PASNO
MVGGSVRAAAKAAMVGGYRSAVYMRRTIVPSSHSSSSASVDEGRKASTFAVDDWVIPDREVFGPVPTHEEAMAATLDLADAFEISKALETPKKQRDSRAKVAQEIGLPEHVHSEIPQGVVRSETSEDNYENLLVASGTPGRVVQAFTLLHESPEAQDVVASLASDKNVWDAVMNNEKVMKFYKKYKSRLSECSSVASSVSGDEAEDGEAASTKNNTDLSQSAGESIKDYLEKMKTLVSEMMTNLSSMMQDLVATSDEGRCKGKIRTLIMSPSKDFPSAPSGFVLLAIASIMVVLLKRA